MIPKAIEDENEIKKIQTPLRSDKVAFPCPLNRESVLGVVSWGSVGRERHSLV